MIKGVTKNLQATSPTCTRSPLRESMQSGSNLVKNASSENLASPASMATALVTTNSATVSLSDSSHSGYLNGDLSVESKAQLKLTFKRNKAPSDTTSIPSPSMKPDDNAKSNDSQGSTVSLLSMHPDSSTLHRHSAVNGKILPTASSSSTHSSHEQTRSSSKRTSGSSASSKRPKSASKRDRNTSSKPSSSVLSLGGTPTTSSLVNGRSNSNERNHDPYQFSVKKEEETILPPKKLRLDSSLSRLSERSESHKDQATNTRNQSTSVDADLLGPCEPGTHVNLDGYVCLETLTGMLMVSVMWRGRNYLGTLIDSSSHGFSPPIPPSYVYASQRYVSGMDASGASTSSSANGRNQRGRGKRRCGFTPTSSARHSRKGRRNPRGSPVTIASSSHGSLLAGDDSNEESQSRGESPASENALDDEEAVMRYQCPQTGCHKRFKEVKAMKFHHDECHTKKPVTEAFSDSEAREKRPSKSGKSTSKSKKHCSSTSSLSASDSAVAAVAAAAAIASAAAASSSSASSSSASSSSSSSKTPSAAEVKTEPPSCALNAPVTPYTGDVKAENAADSIVANDAKVPPTFFKAPVNNGGGLGSPPVLAYSPSSPSVSSLPASPANGLKLPATSSGCTAELLSLPLHSAAGSTKPGGPSTGSDLSVRIPATNNLMVRVGVSSSAGTTVSVNTSSASSRTVAAVTVPVTTIPVMKPSTVASASASASASSTLVHSGKKLGSKESKIGGGGCGGGGGGGSGGSKNTASRGSTVSSGSGGGQTITASSVAIPRASSPSAQSQAGCPSSLKPIQPKPQGSAASSPSPSNSAKPLTPTASPAVGVGAVDANAAKRVASSSSAGNVNPSRKRKKSSGIPTDGSGKRQSIASCSAGRTTTAKPSMPGMKRSNSDMDGSSAGGAEGSSSNQGDRASPAYSDISDDNESPIPILEKEGDVKVLGDSVASGDEVGKASEQASGGGAFYNTPPSLVPFSVYSGDQTAPVGGGNNGVGVAANGSGKNGSANGPPPAVSGRPGTVVKKSEASAGKQVRSTATVIPGTSPLPMKRKPEAEDGDKAAVDAKGPADVGKTAKEPPNLTKIPSSLSLTLPGASSNAPTSSSSSSSSSTAATTPTVAKPTPLNPLSPSRAASEVPASAPAVVTPGPLVGVARSAGELYSAARPDHLRTPPSFHPGPPFVPGSAAAAAAAQFAAHMSPSGLGPQGPGFPPYTEGLMRFVPNGPHPPGHPFSGYPPYGEPFFQPPASSAPQPHKIHELVEKGAVSCATTSSPCTSTAAVAASSAAVAPVKSSDANPSTALDLQTAKSLADMAVAMRHHASLVPNHSGLPQGPTHAGMVPAHFQYGGGIPPAHMTGPPFPPIQQHSLPPGHPPGHAGPDPFFSPSSIVNHPLYK